MIGESNESGTAEPTTGTTEPVFRNGDDSTVSGVADRDLDSNPIEHLDWEFDRRAVVSSKGHSIKISIAPGEAGTRVWIDGTELKELKDIRLSHRAGEVCTVFFELYPSAVEVEGKPAIAVVRDPDKAPMVVVNEPEQAGE